MSRTFSFPTNTLKTSYDQRKFKFHGSISEDTLERIYEGVAETPHLNNYTKDQILLDND